MVTVNLGWCGEDILMAQLAVGFNRISIWTTGHGGVIAVTLWASNGIGLRIKSRMHDVDKRHEIGVLEFESVSDLRSDEKVIDLPGQFSGQLATYKLSLAYKGISADSGLVLRGCDGAESVIVAGASPCTLAVQAPFIDASFEPEYPLDAYIRVAIHQSINPRKAPW